jgi:hypothetical protein
MRYVVSLFRPVIATKASSPCSPSWTLHGATIADASASPAYSPTPVPTPSAFDRAQRRKSTKKCIVLQIVVCSLLSWSLVAAAATDKPLTNQDIAKMIKAELGEETIVGAIANGPSDFDTSADALIALKRAGASQKVLSAVFAAKALKLSDTQISGGMSADTQKSAAAMVRAAASMNDVFLVDGTTRTRLKRASGSEFIKPNPLFRTKSWYVLSGSKADVQVKNGMPAFEFTLPADVKAQDMVVIQKPVVESDSRKIEMAVIGLFVNQDTLKKRDLPVVIEELEGEGRLTTYRVKPASPLAPGEYLLAVRGMYYDFGIEGAN